MALADPAPRDVGPVFTSRNELFLASISTIVVVAGQTQVHTVTVVGLRPTIVPPIVPGRLPSGMRTSQNRRAYCPLPMEATPPNVPDHQGCDRPRLNRSASPRGLTSGQLSD